MAGTGKKGVPGYWRNEVGGELGRAVCRYLESEPLTATDVVLLRRYIEQWIGADGWGDDELITDLRARARGIDSRTAIDRWTHDAEMIGVDPW